MNLSDTEKETPGAAVAAGIPGEHSETLENLLGALALPSLELKEAIEDIPAQLETLSRVTLAKSFIFRRPDGGGFDFDQAAFSRAWAAIAEPPENEGEN